MIVPRVFKSRQRKRKNISIVLSSQKSRRLFADGIFYWCGRRDSKRRLRSKETAGGCFDGRVRVGERGSEPSE